MLVAALPVVAGGAPEYDPFAVDQDHLQGAPDFGFLNAPLTAADRVVARDGHFYRVGDDLQPGTADDSRVRFFGVNLVAGANFPTVEDAGRLARRLRHLGLNLVRLHSLDGLPGPDPEHPESLLSDGPYPSLNPIAVVRLRQLIDALGSEGLYVAIDLHASYPFQPAIDGLPGLADGAAWPDAGKPLNSFYPRVLDLQDSYVRAVFDALHMRDDPSLAMVEVSNEGSLLWAWQTRQLDRLVVGPYRAELQSQWDAFLRQQYGDTATTSAAWGGATGPGPELLPSRWIADGRVDMQSRDNVLTLRLPPAIGPVIVRQAGFSLDAGATYVAEVQARAEAGAGQPIQWEVKEDQAPWRVLASQTIEPTPDWTAYRLSFEAPFALDGSGRFSVTGTGGAVQLRGWSVRMLPTAGLAPPRHNPVGPARDRHTDVLRWAAEPGRAGGDGLSR